MSVRLIKDPEKSLLFARYTHEQKFSTFGIGLGKWKTQKQDKYFLGLGKCRDKIYGDQVNILTSELNKKGVRELKPISDRAMIEDIHNEYVKFFDNESYQNYEIYDSSHYCLSRGSSTKRILDVLDESNNSPLEAKN